MLLARMSAAHRLRKASGPNPCLTRRRHHDRHAGDPGQKTLVMSPEKAPPEYMAVIIAQEPPRPAKRFVTPSEDWHPKILSWRELQPPARYDAGMNAEGIFSVEPTQWPAGIDAR
jgi:hypothetical protein